MRSFYNEGPPQQHLSKPVVGQMVAVRGEDEDELARAQVMEVMEPDKVKVMNSAQLTVASVELEVIRLLEERHLVATVWVLLQMKSVCVSACQVYYLDYGFSVETNWSNLLELHQDFFRLPFQATNVRLAGTYNKMRVSYH